MTICQTVLVIDDNEAFREIMSALLDERGFHTLEADCGESGLSLARDCAPVLILCDRVMPGLNGMEVVRQLREREGTAGTPVIMISGAPIEPDPAECTRLKIVFLPKPFTPAELMQRINTVLN